MALTSDDVNYLVFRYLQESGFVHSAFSFGYESLVKNVDIDPDEIHPGALVRLVQRGLQYMELEANLTEDGTGVDGEFSMLSALEILRAKDADELRALVKAKKEDREELSDDEPALQQRRTRARDDDAAPMEDDAHAVPDRLAFPETAARVFRGHQEEVFSLAWSPQGNLLASTSGDSTSRIWDWTAPVDAAGQPPSLVLRHETGKDESQKDVTTIDWSPDGLFLATGAYDGLARIWSRDGSLYKALEGHNGPVFSLKYSKSGNLILSGSVDSSAIVWDAKTGELKQHMKSHSGAVLDVCWRNATTFATCSTDKTIHICRLDQKNPVRKLTGHHSEVNAITWSPQGRLLASCSDDHNAKIWSVTQEAPLLNLKDPSYGKACPATHSREIYTCRFRPAGAGSDNPNLDLLLATASFDSTVKLWNSETGALVHTLAEHSKPVYTISFSPDGKFVATGAFDKRVLVWDVAQGAVVRSYKTGGGVFEVNWHRDGTKLGVATANHLVHVLDWRM